MYTQKYREMWKVLDAFRPCSTFWICIYIFSKHCLARIKLSGYGKEIEGFRSFFKACKSCPCKVILALVKLEHSEGKGY